MKSDILAASFLSDAAVQYVNKDISRKTQVFLRFSRFFRPFPCFFKNRFLSAKKMQSADFALLSETNPCLTKNTIFWIDEPQCVITRCVSFLFHILTTYERSYLPSHSFIRKKTSTVNSAFTTSMADAQAVDVVVQKKNSSSIPRYRIGLTERFRRNNAMIY